MAQCSMSNELKVPYMTQFTTIPARRQTKTRFMQEADRRRIGASDFVDVLLDGWDLLTGEQQMSAIDRQKSDGDADRGELKPGESLPGE